MPHTLDNDVTLPDHKPESIKNSPVPPSIEKAYHQKCIDLKRRLREVEEANEASEQRYHRLQRAITKMRVNRAFLLDRLSKMQELKDYESDQSSTRPPTPDELAPLPERSHRPRGSRSSIGDRNNAPVSSPPQDHSTFVTPHTHYYHPPQQGSMQHSIASSRSPSHSQMPHGAQRMDHRSPGHQGHYASQPEPLIHGLPNGTSVMLVAPGVPKPAPWHISELDPRHHVKPEFESWTLDEQEDFIFDKEYLPFDEYGTPVLVDYDSVARKYVHIWPNSSRWKDPVVESVRTDSKDHRHRLPRPPPGPDIDANHLRGGEEEARGHAGGFTAANR